jgi:hypothetical protein
MSGNQILKTNNWAPKSKLLLLFALILLVPSSNGIPLLIFLLQTAIRLALQMAIRMALRQVVQQAIRQGVRQGIKQAVKNQIKSQIKGQIKEQLKKAAEQFKEKYIDKMDAPRDTPSTTYTLDYRVLAAKGLTNNHRWCNNEMNWANVERDTKKDWTFEFGLRCGYKRRHYKMFYAAYCYVKLVEKYRGKTKENMWNEPCVTRRFCRGPPGVKFRECRQIQNENERKRCNKENNANEMMSTFTFPLYMNGNCPFGSESMHHEVEKHFRHSFEYYARRLRRKFQEKYLKNVAYQNSRREEAVTREECSLREADIYGDFFSAQLARLAIPEVGRLLTSKWLAEYTEKYIAVDDSIVELNKIWFKPYTKLDKTGEHPFEQFQNYLAELYSLNGIAFRTRRAYQRGCCKEWKKVPETGYITCSRQISHRDVLEGCSRARVVLKAAIQEARKTSEDKKKEAIKKLYHPSKSCPMIKDALTDRKKLTQLLNGDWNTLALKIMDGEYFEEIKHEDIASVMAFNPNDPDF